MIRAAVFVPLDVPDAACYAAEAAECAGQRGYDYAGTYRQPEYVDRLLAEGVVQVVVFAREHHWDPGRGWPAEFCDETTRALRPLPPMPQRARERNGTVNWGRYRVRELIDGDGPVPCGLDPESIAAARRIARRLDSA